MDYSQMVGLRMKLGSLTFNPENQNFVARNFNGEES